MRASADPFDLGYINWVRDKPLRVFLNGVEISRVVTADEEQRLVVQARADENGNSILNADKTEILFDTLYGDVRIEKVNP